MIVGRHALSGAGESAKVVRLGGMSNSIKIRKINIVVSEAGEGRCTGTHQVRDLFVFEPNPDDVLDTARVWCVGPGVSATRCETHPRASSARAVVEVKNLTICEQ